MIYHIITAGFAVLFAVSVALAHDLSTRLEEEQQKVLVEMDKHIKCEVERRQ